ncbi:uncharacterized protein DS421_16g569060 [Arachis hypogaea]|nr:uncharacterized protein DS421_16g569060 [Arachis hypogaea]
METLFRCCPTMHLCLSPTRRISISAELAKRRRSVVVLESLCRCDLTALESLCCHYLTAPESLSVASWLAPTCR